MFVFLLFFTAILLLYSQKNDDLLYAKRNRYKMADRKIDLQILSLCSQSSEGSAAHPVILLADDAGRAE